jgi:hypothetical protein
MPNLTAYDRKMDAVRNFASSNRWGIINAVYVIAFLVTLYYIYKYLMAGSELEVDLQSVEVSANEPRSYALPADQPEVHVKSGGEYTISFWMYITSWDYRSGMAKSVLQIVDTKAPDYALLSTILYANEPKMMVRVHTESPPDSTVDYTMNANFDNLMAGSANGGMPGASIDTPMCDITDIDLQRWINVTISVNGRIVDVYYDGKLNRSCVLPSIPIAPENGVQVVMTGKKGGFGGKVSGIQFFAYPLTPGRIYSIYQAGPRGAAGFLGYAAEKLGIKLTYSGVGGVQKSL